MMAALINLESGAQRNNCTLPPRRSHAPVARLKGHQSVQCPGFPIQMYIIYKLSSISAQPGNANGRSWRWMAAERHLAAEGWITPTGAAEKWPSYKQMNKV